jgi:hypothetical protein
VWTDLSADVISFSVNRPSTRQQGPLYNYSAGTLSLTLDNSDGKYDPDNLYGPYVTNGQTQLLAMVPIRVRAVFGGINYPVYYGFSDGWIPADITYAGEYAELTVGATDAFKVLAGITLASIPVEGVNADTGSRVKDILTRAGWYSSADRLKIDTGNTVLQGTTLGADPLSLMQLAVDTEIGQLYQDATGAIVFRCRHALVNDTRSNTVQAAFGDMSGSQAGLGYDWNINCQGTPTDGTYFIATSSDASLISVNDDFTDVSNPRQIFTVTAVGAPFAGYCNISVTPTAQTIMSSGDVVNQVNPMFAASSIQRASDDTVIVNDVQATRVGGNLQEATSQTSITQYLFPRTYARTDLIHTSDSDALNWAQYIVYIGRFGESRFDSVKINPLADPVNLWPQVLGREIGDRIQVWVRPPSVPVPIHKDCFIVGIQHDWNSADSTWLTTWTLQDATKYGNFLTLGNSTLGKLDNNALTF